RGGEQRCEHEPSERVSATAGRVVTAVNDHWVLLSGLEQGHAHANAAANRARARREKAPLVDHDPGAAQSMLLHHREQDGGIRGMQADAPARSGTAELADMRGAVNGEVAVVE